MKILQLSAGFVRYEHPQPGVPLAHRDRIVVMVHEDEGLILIEAREIEGGDLESVETLVKGIISDFRKVMKDEDGDPKYTVLGTKNAPMKAYKNIAARLFAQFEEITKPMVLVPAGADPDEIIAELKGVYSQRTTIPCTPPVIREDLINCRGEGNFSYRVKYLIGDTLLAQSEMYDDHEDATREAADIVEQFIFDLEADL